MRFKLNRRHDEETPPHCAQLDVSGRTPLDEPRDVEAERRLIDEQTRRLADEHQQRRDAEADQVADHRWPRLDNNGHPIGHRNNGWGHW